jgi:CheY-like chemotaxis protein
MAAERAATLVRRLLAFARREEVRPRRVNAADVLAQVALLAQHTLSGRWQCRVEPADEVWPVLVDPHLLEVALLNLLVNARDAMPTGGVVTVAVNNLRDGEGDSFGWSGGEAVLFRVQDTGDGMSPDVLARLGEPFFTTKAVGQGTGLGLAMVRSFVQQSSGRLHFASSLGEGTTVGILLPKAPTTLLDAGGEASAPQLAMPHGSGESILLVDDDSQVRAIAAAQLRDLGYTVLEAGDAESAFSLSKAASVLDLLICDVVMPGVNGPALARQMGRERPGVPVLFISGFADAAELPEDADLLRKPFRMEEMAEKIASLLNRRAAEGNSTAR